RRCARRASFPRGASRSCRSRPSSFSRSSSRSYSGRRCFGFLGRCALSRRVDLLPLVLQELLGALLERARLLDPEPRLDRELVLVLAEDVLHAAIARVLEELDGALAD